MEELTGQFAVRVGVDLAKNVFQVHAENSCGKVLAAKSLSRQKFLGWCVSNLTAGTVVAMEACSGAHHWARQLQSKGFVPLLLPAHLVEPFRRQGKRGKNDANDAQAIWEAAGRPRIHTVPVKTPEQQGILAVHRLREAYKTERTAIINTIRSLLTEAGVVFPQGPDALRLGLTDALEDATNELTGLSRMALHRAHLHWLEIELHMAWCDEQIELHARRDERAKAISRIPGIGPITASALVATVGNFKQFASGGQFGCWIGLTPSQDSSGGKTRLGRITKRGDTYLRTLLIQAAKSAVMTAHKRSDPISQWTAKLRDRVGWQKAVVALANKHARIVWAMLVKGLSFDAKHVSQWAKPANGPDPIAAQASAG
jgi:transposase